MISVLKKRTNRGEKMKRVVLLGGFGKLGTDILKALVSNGYDTLSLDLVIRDIPEIEGKYKKKRVDVTKKEELRGLFDGYDTVISTVGLTKTSATTTNYDIDLQGNLNILEEAKRAGVEKFGYISVLKADKNPKVPMLDAKAKFEKALKASGMEYVIFRPTGYFYDIAHIFEPMVEKGEVTLLGKNDVSANVIDTSDFAIYIIEHMNDKNVTYDVGGKETYTYEEIAKLFFQRAGKTPVIKRAPVFLFDMLIFINHFKKNGKEAIIRFSKWTLTESMVAENKVGELSFRDYVLNKE